MQKKNGLIRTDWVELGTFIDDEVGTSEWRIYNIGNDTILLQENTTTPDAGSNEGEPLQPNKYAVFKKGTSDLYLRARNSVSVINVVEVENA